MQVSTVEFFLPTPRKISQVTTIKGNSELLGCTRASTPGRSVHSALQPDRAHPVMSNGDPHTMIIVLKLGGYRVAAWDDPKAAPESDKSTGISIVKHRQSRVNNSAVAKGPPPAAATATEG